MKKLIKILSIFNAIILVFMMTSCGKADSKEKYINFKNLNHEDKVEKMREEVKYMCDNLEKKHKNMYHTISKEEFKIKENKIMNELPQIENEIDYYFALTELISSVGDAHTTVGNTNLIMDDMDFYDFKIEKFSNDWFLTGIEEENSDKLGFKVKAINNVNIDEVFNKILFVYSNENSYSLANTFHFYAQNAQLLKKTKVIDNINEDIKLTLEDNNGSIVEIKAPLINSIYENNQVLLEDKAKPMDTAYLEDKTYWADKLNDDVYYIQYNRCVNDKTFPMKKFKDEVSDTIKSGSFKKVIIDLRYNGGGNSMVIAPLYDKIADLQDTLDFKVYILIGNKTFSSAILNAYDGKNQLNAVLLGEPSGDTLNHYGEVKKFELPYSGFEIRYSTKFFQNKYGYDKDALYPDILVERNLQDYIYGIDSAVQAVIDD